LIRQYGEAWYKELTLLIEEKQNESASWKQVKVVIMYFQNSLI
jgi:hypothetical protein